MILIKKKGNLLLDVRHICWQCKTVIDRKSARLLSSTN